MPIFHLDLTSRLVAKLILLLPLFISSLFSYGQRVPYREGKLWGLADTLGKIVVSPSYTEITPAGNYVYGNTTGNYFIVKQNEKFGMLNNDRIIMSPKYQRLHADSVFIKETVSKYSQFKLYNLRGELLLKDTVNSIESLGIQSYHLYLIYTSGGAGIFWYNTKNQTIQQWVSRGLKGVTIYPNKDIFIKSKKYKIVLDPQINNFSMIPVNDNSKEPLIRGDVMPVDGLYYGSSSEAVTQRVNSDFMIKIFSFAIRANKIKLITSLQKYNSDYNRKIDSMDFNINYQKAFIGKYDSEKIIPHHFNIDVTKVDTNNVYSNYIKYTEGGKYGVIASYKIIPAVYDTLEYFSNGLKKNYFIVGKYLKGTSQIKWGIINSDNEMVLPVIYDEISRKHTGDFWMLKIEGKYGLANYAGKIEFEAKYDSIVSRDSFYSTFFISDNNKYGYINPYAKCFPVLPYKISGYKENGNYITFSLVDEKENPLGYGDKKGFLYFK